MSYMVFALGSDAGEFHGMGWGYESEFPVCGCEASDKVHVLCRYSVGGGTFSSL